MEQALIASSSRLIDRLGLLETRIAVEKTSGAAAARRLELDRNRFQVIELTEAIERAAADMASLYSLRTLDAVHLASAVASRPHVMPVMASWDRRLRAAAEAEGLELFPAVID